MIAHMVDKADGRLAAAMAPMGMQVWGLLYLVAYCMGWGCVCVVSLLAATPANLLHIYGAPAALIWGWTDACGCSAPHASVQPQMGGLCSGSCLCTS